VSASKP